MLDTRNHSAHVKERYDKLAPLIPLFDAVFGVTMFRYRSRAILALPLRRGDTVVELGCGTGLNFPHLQRAVGPAGRIVGVDFSSEMLARARRRIERASWTNVELVQEDIRHYPLPLKADGVLWGLCYNTLNCPFDTLARMWASLRPGTCVAIMDGKAPDFAETFFRRWGKAYEAYASGRPVHQTVEGP